jgi:alkylation response protein AidB-like acyl-CoA dehydrogenase
MDFTLSDTQRDIAELADRIVAEKCPPETLRKLERGETGSRDRLAADAWSALAEADLLALALPEKDGGSGLGILEAALVAQQVGRRVALVPYWTSTAAALAIARWGTDEQRSRFLPGAATGAAPLAVAMWQPVERGSAAHPAVTVSVDGDGYRLDGLKSPVPWVGVAGTCLVTARRDPSGERAVFLVETDAPGVTVVDEKTITQEPTGTLRLDNVHVNADAQLGRTSDVVKWVELHTQALLLATMLGVCEEALALTAKYVSEREQFSTPIGTFQAVAHRCADAYIATEAIRLTALQAFWRLGTAQEGAEDLAPGGEAVDIARFWACEGGNRVVHAAQHLHGGIGVDIDYPIHRYFRWATTIELLLGGTNSSLSAIGNHLAAEDDAVTSHCDEGHTTETGSAKL